MSCILVVLQVYPMEQKALVLSLINHLCEQSWTAGQAAPAPALPSSPFFSFLAPGEMWLSWWGSLVKIACPINNLKWVRASDHCQG